MEDVNRLEMQVLRRSKFFFFFFLRSELLVWTHLPRRRIYDVTAKLKASKHSAVRLVFNNTESKITLTVLSEIIFSRITII